MMLPEHKETIIRRQLEEGRRDNPTLYPQEVELIEQALAESFHAHRKIKVRLFDEYENQELIGMVTVIHTYRREFKLAIGVGEWEWIRIEDILSASS
ncbi:YolD-like family protein [Paenibacillus glucanolyticus]|uniref:YolD-like family protein n=1 Tax=Paenibacillus glucanolyticus TaxID=59843 RepID=UPI003692D815